MVPLLHLRHLLLHPWRHPLGRVHPPGVHLPDHGRCRRTDGEGHRTRAGAQHHRRVRREHHRPPGQLHQPREQVPERELPGPDHDQERDRRDERDHEGADADHGQRADQRRVRGHHRDELRGRHAGGLAGHRRPPGRHSSQPDREGDHRRRHADGGRQPVPGSVHLRQQRHQGRPHGDDHGLRRSHPERQHAPRHEQVHRRVQQCFFFNVGCRSDLLPGREQRGPDAAKLRGRRCVHGGQPLQDALQAHDRRQHLEVRRLAGRGWERVRRVRHVHHDGLPLHPHRRHDEQV
mmetsp:Transcript_33305/g.98905  ORF Transcript_33305/g.98905 Transcript_33305/m.98905 type:complete len:291 (-) Transcript_33305:276-1148(-)